MLSLTCPHVPQWLLPSAVPPSARTAPQQQVLSPTSPTFIPLGACSSLPDPLPTEDSPTQQVLGSPRPAGPSLRGRTRCLPSASSRLSLFPPPASQPAAPHRRGGFLSCTVSMALPAAAQTRSLLHPPPGPPRARPADPPTLPLSAPTGSGAPRASGAGRRGPSRDHVVRCLSHVARGARPGTPTVRPPRVRWRCRLGAARFARDTGTQATKPSPPRPGPHSSDRDPGASGEAPSILKRPSSTRFLGSAAPGTPGGICEFLPILAGWILVPGGGRTALGCRRASGCKLLILFS